VLAGPFTGILSGRNSPEVDHTTFWAALLAIVVYTVAAWVLTGIGNRRAASA
jgi:uncharacterized membrane protein YvlD (DUF360 family)